MIEEDRVYMSDRFHKYFVRVEARFGAKTKFSFEGANAKGYFQRLGVTARNEEELTELVRSFVKDDSGAEVRSIDDLSVPDFEGRDKDIADECGDLHCVGIWYESGLAFFGDDES